MKIPKVQSLTKVDSRYPYNYVADFLIESGLITQRSQSFIWVQNQALKQHTSYEALIEKIANFYIEIKNVEASVKQARQQFVDNLKNAQR
jgi:hypothetical protein